MNDAVRTEAEIENAVAHLLKAGLTGKNISLCFNRTVAQINLIGYRFGVHTLKRGRPVKNYPELTEEQKRKAVALYAAGGNDIIRIQEILGEDININSIFNFFVESDHGFGLLRCACGRVFLYVGYEKEHCDHCLGVPNKRRRGARNADNGQWSHYFKRFKAGADAEGGVSGQALCQEKEAETNNLEATAIDR